MLIKEQENPEPGGYSPLPSIINPHIKNQPPLPAHQMKASSYSVLAWMHISLIPGLTLPLT